MIWEAAPSRRSRTLSEDERALWDAIARQVKPLKKHRPVKARAKPQGKPAPLPRNEPVVAPPPPAVAPASAPLSKPAVPPLAPLGRRERGKLSRGRAGIEARLDLHGMTQARAHHALGVFLHRAHHEGLTFVLVITGKGRTGGDSGILRRQVPQWLALPEFRGLVVGFEEAHIAHGGAGALYVRVRRARQ